MLAQAAAAGGAWRRRLLILGASGAAAAVAAAVQPSFADTAPGSQPISGSGSGVPLDKLACQKAVPPPRTPIVLVACGSFNPPTTAHMRMFDVATAALAERGWDVWGCYMSPVGDAYGKPGLAPASQRLEMCRIAADSSPLVMVTDWEARQPGHTRTLAVLQHVSRALADALVEAGGDNNIAAAPRVMLLCGSDLLASMETPGVWVAPDVLLREHGVVVVARPGGVQPNELLARRGSLLAAHAAELVVVEDPTPSDLSSSTVRSLLAQGQPVHHLLPPGVEEYVRRAGLYVTNSKQ